MVRENIIGEYIRDYYGGLMDTIKKMSQPQLDNVRRVLHKAKDKGNSIFLMGNGGSASTCEHICNDFTKMAGMKSFSLLSVPIITAYANDIDYSSVFIEQLKRVILKPGDVVIAISGSGNSPNIIKALQYAKKHGAVTIGFLGFDGGRAKEIVDFSVHITSNNYGIVEDLHLSLGHYFAMKLKEV